MGGKGSVARWPQANGRSATEAPHRKEEKWGVWGAKGASPVGRRPMGGQRPKPPIVNKALRSALNRPT
jgi:hypothetical protein